MRGGVFLYPGDRRRGYEQGRLRLVYEANPIAFLIEQAGGARHRRRRRRILDLEPDEPAPAHAAGLRLGARGRRASPATTPTRAASASARRCSAIAACSAPDGAAHVRQASRSSRSPARPAPARPRCKHTFEQIFRREKIEAAFIEGDAFHRYDRAGDARRRSPRRTKRATRNFSHFSAEANVLEDARGGLRRLRPRRAPAAPATMSMTTRRQSVYGAPPGTFTDWRDVPADSDLLFYEGLHGCVVTDKVNLAKHADLKIGVVPVINLEWIQKIHRDRATRGYSTEAVTDVILRRMPDYVRYICPAVHRRPTSTSSACRSSTPRTRSSRAGSRRRTNRCWSSASPIRAASISPTCSR